MGTAASAKPAAMRNSVAHRCRRSPWVSEAVSTTSAMDSTRERGSALVELAIALPLLVAVLVGTTDFARVFYLATELTNAARAGAHSAPSPKRTAATNIKQPATNRSPTMQP